MQRYRRNELGANATYMPSRHGIAGTPVVKWEGIPDVECISEGGWKSIMSISNAVERHHIVFVYDDQGRITAQIYAGHCPGDGLKGFTSSTVTVRKLGRIFVHNERGGVQSRVATRAG
jgi:hypothetical protein